jgi:G:T-mismatch repair DNA endonuclease (very short patch repair protein)
MAVFGIGTGVTFLKSLSDMSWRICIVWEYSVKGSKKRPIEEVEAIISGWLTGDEHLLEISG